MKQLTRNDLKLVPKNIVIIISKSEIGGAQTWVLHLKEILESEYNIFLVTSDYGWLTGFFDPKRVVIIPGLASMRRPDTIFKIRSALKKFNAHFVISNSASAGLYSRIAKLIFPHKHIYVSHGWSCLYNGGRLKFVFCFIEKILSIFTDKVLCVSNNDQYKAINLIGISPTKTIVIRNGAKPCEKKKFVNDVKRILFLGRMIHPKRPDLLAEVALNFPDVNFYFIGDGPLLSELKNSYKSVKNIFFLGEIRNFINFKEYDLFVLSSDSEGLPMSAVEAATANLPLLLSNVGGCSELLLSNSEGYKNGLLFNNELTDLTEKLQIILNDYTNYYKAAKDISEQFEITNNKSLYLNLIQGLR
ncbi:glycosyltransferase [Salmonella bongori]|uniref:Glycosyltransferase family 4 protein n=2 Tax=Salmonella TaxID=590 RepID=A0A750KNC0_SALER|nr:glycosyltransferase [Salmonella bongori]MBA2135861.1 glycosyltransferase family 4 protein [Salmonella bongori serovar 66:z39:-]QXY86074.1 glycosyltransferase [Salmonella bongori]